MKSQILNKMEDFLRNATKCGLPIIKGEIRKSFGETKKEIAENIFTAVQISSTLAILFSPLFMSKSVRIPSSSENLDRTINITYNEIHVVNNYKGGQL